MSKEFKMEETCTVALADQLCEGSKLLISETKMSEDMLYQLSPLVEPDAYQARLHVLISNTASYADSCAELVGRINKLVGRGGAVEIQIPKMNFAITGMEHFIIAHIRLLATLNSELRYIVTYINDTEFEEGVECDAESDNYLDVGILSQLLSENVDIMNSVISAYRDSLLISQNTTDRLKAFNVHDLGVESQLGVVNWVANRYRRLGFILLRISQDAGKRMRSSESDYDFGVYCTADGSKLLTTCTGAPTLATYAIIPTRK
jgi:hypothetical protein